MENYTIIKDINRFLIPSDILLCTGYEGVNTLNGQAHEFPAWYYAKIIKPIHGDRPDTDILSDFIEKNRVDYWIYDFRNEIDNFLFHDMMATISENCLGTQNLVYAHGVI